MAGVIMVGRGLRERSRRCFPIVAAGLLAIAAGGCGGNPDPGDATADWVHEEEIRGDTTVIRTLGGSVWGDTMRLVPELVIGEFDGEDPYVFGNVTAVDRDAEGRIWVADRQAGELRVFGPDGEFLQVVGRQGDGPGEYQQPDHLRVTAGGEVVVRDQQGARFVVFSTEGEFLRTWRLSGTYFTSQPFLLDDGGRILNPDLRLGTDLDDENRQVLVRMDVATGEPLDTVPQPRPPSEPAYVELRIEQGDNRMVQRSNVPFHPTGTATLTPSGGTLIGLGRRYAVHRTGPDGSVLVIERPVGPVPVAPAERAAARAQIEQGFRQRDASWQWNGPEIPETKPPFLWAGVGRDGSIWVQRHTRGREVDNPDFDPEGQPAQQQRTMWEEDEVMDVFDEEGRYLGPVRMPDGFSPLAGGVLSTDEVLIRIPEPDLGYHQVVRYRLEPASEQDSEP